MLIFYTQYNIKSIKVQHPKPRKIKLIDNLRHTVSKSKSEAKLCIKKQGASG